jgi:hypothetical protein
MHEGVTLRPMEDKVAGRCRQEGKGNCVMNWSSVSYREEGGNQT